MSTPFMTDKNLKRKWDENTLLRLFKKYEKFFEFTTIETFKKADIVERILLIMYAWAWNEGYRVVANVTEAANCGAGYKKGDRLVFDIGGFFIPEESKTSARACWALTSPLCFNFTWNTGLLSNGILPTSPYNEIVECLDPGEGKKGGYGHVKLKIDIK